MNSTANYQSALGQLRGVLSRLKPGDPVYDGIVASRDPVFARYQPLFSNPEALAIEEFRTFLYLDNNRHWSGLYRKGLEACKDVPRLRLALKTLLHEARPIEARFDAAIDSVSGMGKGLASAILLIMFPNKYGVWNNTSEAGLRELKLWPSFEGAGTFGKKYVRVNEVLNNLAHDLGIDLWTLDAIWWAIIAGSELPNGMEVPAPTQPTVVQSDSIEPLPLQVQRFGLERHLHDFLFDNWDRMELGHDWAIYGDEKGDDSGYEFPTDVGRIDLLAKHRREKRWLILELKRNQTDDTTVGQVLRYMGWYSIT